MAERMNAFNNKYQRTLKNELKQNEKVNDLAQPRARSVIGAVVINWLIFIFHKPCQSVLLRNFYMIRFHVIYRTWVVAMQAASLTTIWTTNLHRRMLNTITNITNTSNTHRIATTIS